MIAIESPTAALRRRDRGEPLVEAARVDPDLERPEPFLPKSQRGFGAFRWRQEHPARGIGGQSIARAAEQRRDRDTGDLAGDVPQRRLEWPVPPGVEIDRLEHADVARDRQRILPDEQVLERLEPVHRVARTEAGHALIGLDADDRDRELRARHRVPGRREGWLERHTQPLEPDGADPHERSIADRLATPRLRAAAVP